MKLGCHLSISKGFMAAAQRAREFGAGSFQYFTKNPRGFRGQRKIDPADARAGIAFCREHGIRAVAHAPYILNLSTPKEDLWEMTIDSLVTDLEICSTYRTPSLVVHCGKHVAMGEDYGMARMVETLDRVLDRYQGETLICLENTAGQGTELGMDLEQLLETRARVAQPQRIGFCWDSCHSFVAGQWQPDTWEDYVRRMQEVGYLDHLRLVHLNDSKAPFESRKDRHEKVGQGYIGATGIEGILNTGALEGLPVILETPVSDEREYIDELAWLRAHARA